MLIAAGVLSFAALKKPVLAMVAAPVQALSVVALAVDMMLEARPPSGETVVCGSFRLSAAVTWGFLMSVVAARLLAAAAMVRPSSAPPVRGS